MQNKPLVNTKCKFNLLSTNQYYSVYNCVNLPPNKIVILSQSTKYMITICKTQIAPHANNVLKQKASINFYVKIEEDIVVVLLQRVFDKLTNSILMLIYEKKNIEESLYTAQSRLDLLIKAMISEVEHVVKDLNCQYIQHRFHGPMFGMQRCRLYIEDLHTFQFDLFSRHLQVHSCKMALYYFHQIFVYSQENIFFFNLYHLKANFK